MKRMRIVGLCLVAVFATMAVASATASATLPAFFECAKVAKAEKGMGKYNKLCIVEGKHGLKENEYEIKEGVGKAATKAAKGSGKKATLHTPAVGGEVTCTAFKDELKITTPKHEAKVISTFTGCVSLGKKCSSSGAAAGTIKTNALEGDLGYINAAEKRVGVDLKAEGGGELAAFDCEGLEIKVTGSVIGETSPVNTFTKSETSTFAVVSGLQKYKKLEGEPEDVLESEINGSGPFESGQEASALNKGEYLELRA